jgi:glucose/arabinose dehydrogenase
MRERRVLRLVPLIAGLVAVLLAVAGAFAGQQPIGNGQGGVDKQLVGNFDAPIYIARAPGVGDTIYVVERGGDVRAVVNGTRHHFLNISGRVNTDGERGFLSIAFDPRYQRNGLFYAYYTNNDGNIEIDEFHTNSDNDAREVSRRRVITIQHPNASNHNGGTAAFGPGRFLYLATGDGGINSGNAQDRNSLLGKVLRINPHGAHDGDYHVPKGNPFVGIAGKDEIFALGLRNPFRWSFDGRRITIGDVGSGSWEEIDYERFSSLRRANFGWPDFEGDHPPSGSPSGPGHYEPPISEYPHPLGAAAITGGVVVRDESLDTLYRRYLYADFYEGDLRSLIPHFGGATDDKDLGVHIANPAAITRGPHGRIYVASLTGGQVYRLIHS